MIEQFIDILITYAGATLGIAIIIVPISLGLYFAQAWYWKWQATRMKDQMQKEINEEVERQQDHGATGRSTPDWT